MATDLVSGAAVVAAALVVVIAISLVQGAYHLDPHHWGLILGNAVDINRGRIPYKDVFIQYGVLSALLPALFLKIGGTQLAMIAGVAAFYAVGIAGTYFISLQIARDRRLAVFTFLTALIVHPMANTPWPNYLAYPFIVFGCLLVMKAERSAWMGFWGGVLLALAVLCRENLVFAILIALLILPVIELWCSDNWRSVALRLTSWLGFVLPLMLFALCLKTWGLWGYWWQTAVELPKLYAQDSFQDGLVAAMLSLLAYVMPLDPFNHARRFVLGLVLLAALFYCLLGLARGEARRLGPGVLFLAVTTGLLSSSALHNSEIFRLASSILAGTALLYAAANRFRAATPVFAVSIALMLAGSLGPDSGNYNLPSRAQIESGVPAQSPKIFAGQRWAPDVYAYYDWYGAAMGELERRNCGIRYLRNRSIDGYLEMFSPFMQHQLMPSGNPAYDWWGAKLRPDYDMAARLRERDIVIVTNLRLGASTPEDFVPPSGFVEFARRPIPASTFTLEPSVTLLWVPASCGVAAASPSSG